MGDETPQNAMNLDLNLGPVDDEALPDSMNLEDWLDGPVRRIREAISQRGAIRHMPSLRWDSDWRSLPYVPSTWGTAVDLIDSTIPYVPSTWGTAGELIDDIGRETGEGSVAVEERPTDEAKACDNNNNGFLEDEAFGKKENLGNGNGSEGSIFDCNICLDLAKDPVVTCCGHLFCWPCLYRWVHVHSDAKECPMCKGEVTVNNVTPIYGGGSDNREIKEDLSLKIPPRPQARRVESWRQTIQRNRSSIPVEEMIQHGLEWARDLFQVQDPDNTRGSLERSDSLLDLILMSREIQREQNSTEQPDNLVDMTSRPVNAEAGENRRHSPLFRRRPRTYRTAMVSNLTSALSSYDRIGESYFRSHQEQPAPVDDRDSVSSIAAVIQSESQTVDTAVEIDSTVSRSTLSSSRRRNDSRVSDVDSGDSRTPRRRRFN